MVEGLLKRKKTISKPLKKSPLRLFSRLKGKIGQKGLINDPFVYLMLISLLFGLFSFAASKTLLPSLSKRADPVSPKTSGFWPKNVVLANGQIQNLFVGAEKNFLKESPDLFLIQKNSVRACTSPLLISSQLLGALTDAGEASTGDIRDEVIEYTVKSGDNLIDIANQFAISLETLLWANNLNKNSRINPGQSLLILPVSGTLHYVVEGETLTNIAKRYQADQEKIISFNDLSADEKLLAGDILVVPGGVMPPKINQPQDQALIPLSTSYFLYPVPSFYRITQRLHWFNAVDFSNGACGGPVYATAQGVVQKTGRSRSAGNYIRILHPNGVVTFYGHLFNILVEPGEEVSQGDVIGYIGNTGYTIGQTGCHLHFAVYGARNPFAE